MSQFNEKAQEAVRAAMENDPAGLTVGEMGVLMEISEVPVITAALFTAMKAAYNLGFTRGQKTGKKAV